MNTENTTMADLTMSQFASKDDLIAAQAVRIAELEAEVDAERRHHGIRNASAVRTLHALGYSWRGTDAWQPPAEQGKCLHQIAEPQPEALRLAAWLLHRGMSGIKQNDIEASNQLRWLHAESLQHQQELAAYRFTVENREARIAELEAELEAVGAGGVQRLAAAPQAAVPLFWVRLLRDGLYEGPVHNNSVSGKMLRDEKPGEWHPLYLHAAPAHPAEGVPALKNTWSFCEKTCIASCTQSGLRFQLDEDEMPHEYGHAFADMMNVIDATGRLPSELLATHPTQQGPEQAIEWPNARDVGRFGDMSKDGFIRVGLDADNDVYVSVCNGESMADIEFCNPGGGGGGRSSRTRMALIALMCAIEADNASSPSLDFWKRTIAAQAKQGGA